MAKGKQPINRQKLTLECECGTTTVINPYFPHTFDLSVPPPFVWRVKDGFTTDSGTDFPAEIWVECPECREEAMYLG